MHPRPDHGRLTLPTEVGAEQDTLDLIRRLGADAVRNSDGTALPDGAAEMVDRVYATYFPTRGDNEWARAHLEELQQIYLLSDRHTATGGPLTIDPLVGYLRDQVRPDTDHDPARWWEVIDRTTGRLLDPGEWQVDNEGVVTLPEPTPWHEYTVTFLAWQTWDPTQMYNYITNNWTDREKELPYDPRHEATWAHIQGSLDTWLAEHPEVDVVRFTTFFYHFTLVFNDRYQEKFVDWFGYTASVSTVALEAFEAEHGYRLRPEDLVDAGTYHSTLREPTDRYRDWIAFQQRFVAARAADLVAQVHAAGKEAMMFLGDTWIGTEPYGEHFASIGLDALVGSVGTAATTRMITDVEGVRYTEGRLLPYFFPDVFRPGGDPLGQAQESWIGVRRALLRRPLDRIGYGGYLSLAVQFPDFVEYAEQCATEFRELHARTDGATPWTAPVRVGVLNHWGSLRTWQTHMVAHALPYPQIEAYQGVLESLAGLPVDVDFLSFQDVLDGGVPERIDVLLVAGSAGTAFSGGAVWGDEELTSTLRAWVHAGGGLIGVGEPTAHPVGGRTFALADVLGVDQEVGLTLSTDKYVEPVGGHYVTADLPARHHSLGDDGGRSVYPAAPDTLVLLSGGAVDVAVHPFGQGRAVYLSGLPFSVANDRLLHRAVLWAAGAEQTTDWWSDNPACGVAAFPAAGCAAVVNNTRHPQRTTVHVPGQAPVVLELPAAGMTWIDLAEGRD